jgi:F0F1-type ATP synthase membrane subunit c/vacuolar-type H+-ATPase subunit K
VIGRARGENVGRSDRPTTPLSLEGGVLAVGLRCIGCIGPANSFGRSVSIIGSNHECYDLFFVGTY